MSERDPEDPSTGAFFRMLAARLNIAALGVFRISADGAHLWAASKAFRATWGRDGPEAVPEAIAAALTTGEAARIDARRLGRSDGYAAVAPIRAGGTVRGYLLVLDQRRRWLGPRAADELRDAAHLLSALMPVAEAATATGPVAGGPLSRVEVHRLIELHRAGQRAGERTVVLLIDLDRFRAVNDALGPLAGDRILAAIADRLVAGSGTAEIAHRLEGDRFLIIGDGPDGDLGSLADRVLRLIGTPFDLDGRSVTTQASIGIASDETGELPATRLLAQADGALQRAKLEGRNRAVIHETKLEAATRDRSRLELDLAKAAEAGEMRLAFQPYVDLATGRVTGAEALLRWHHPTRGEMHPATFIPIAERSGQILRLGNWALRRALRQAESWPDPVRLAVNISALQFHQADFIAEVDRALAGCDFPAGRLELEITETVLMRDNPETIAQLRALIARGIRIALDDFGTGYSALAYLARLPHHRIKLDRAFVQDLDNPATAELIRAIVASARAQGVEITAEGVERDADLDAVRRIGFTHAQGYATGTPVDDPAAFLPARTPDLASAQVGTRSGAFLLG